MEFDFWDFVSPKGGNILEKLTEQYTDKLLPIMLYELNKCGKSREDQLSP